MLLGVDVGGTFTDAVLVDEAGRVHTAKVSSTIEDQSIGVMDAVEAVLAKVGGRHDDVQMFAHGTTVATNALLQGEVARTALIATEGFLDIVELRRQARPHLYRLCDAPPPPLAQMRFAAPERMTPDGPLQRLRRAEAEALVRAVAAGSPEAVAVALLHSYAHPEHEMLLGELIADAMPSVHVSLSHDLVGTFREYERTSSTEVDAALSPLLGRYLRTLDKRARSAGLREPQVMQSSGGLATAKRAASHAALTVLSGPAGGVGAARLIARLAGAEDALCFDMGGTSCDVCLIASGSVQETAERTIGGRPISLPALDIHTVGAGGGSIAWRDDGGALRVGPRSAGATPGPACYGRGGTQPTVTDADLLLGRLLADAPLPGGLTLDVEAAERALKPLADSLRLETLQCAEGVLKIAESEMLRALRVMSVERGVDPRRCALVAFGGAGGLHAAALAEALEIDCVLCPRSSGVLCALGLAIAAPRIDVARTVMLRGDELSERRLNAEQDALMERALRLFTASSPSLQITAEMRYVGQSFELRLDAPKGTTPADLRSRFEEVHRERYGYADEGSAVELVTLRVCASGQMASVDLSTGQAAGPAHGSCRIVCDGAELMAQAFRGELEAGRRLTGPAVCARSDSTVFLPSGWTADVDVNGTLAMRRLEGPSSTDRADAEASAESSAVSW